MDLYQDPHKDIDVVHNGLEVEPIVQAFKIIDLCYQSDL